MTVGGREAYRANPERSSILERSDRELSVAQELVASNSAPPTPAGCLLELLHSEHMFDCVLLLKTRRCLAGLGAFASLCRDNHRKGRIPRLKHTGSRARFHPVPVSWLAVGQRLASPVHVAVLFCPVSAMLNKLQASSISSPHCQHALRVLSAGCQLVGFSTTIAVCLAGLILRVGLRFRRK